MSENVSMKRPETTDRTLAEACLVRAGMKEKLENSIISPSLNIAMLSQNRVEERRCEM